MRHVEASLNYLAQTGRRPEFNMVDPARTHLPLEAHTALIADARTLERPPSLDVEGFALVEHQTTVTDRDDARRSADTAPAARFVHTDYTDLSARDYFLPQVMDSAEALGRYRRIVVYQTWRALSGPPVGVPLAVCDGRSVSRDDMVTADTILGSEYGIAQSFEYSMCRHNPEHRWRFFSDMRPDEVLVFKGHDFDPDRPARLFHTAFDDPSAPPDAPPRASIEARAFAFFED